MLSTAAAISLIGAAAAHADPAKPRTQTTNDTFTVRADTNPQTQQFGPQPVRKSLQWDAEHGRWSLKLDMDQPVGRDAQWKDVQAGAYFRVTPQLRVGGAVGVGGDPENPVTRSQPKQQQAPRIRLETAFKF